MMTQRIGAVLRRGSERPIVVPRHARGRDVADRQLQQPRKETVLDSRFRVTRPGNKSVTLLLRKSFHSSQCHTNNLLLRMKEMPASLQRRNVNDNVCEWLQQLHSTPRCAPAACCAAATDRRRSPATMAASGTMSRAELAALLSANFRLVLLRLVRGGTYVRCRAAHCGKSAPNACLNCCIHVHT